MTPSRGLSADGHTKSPSYGLTSRARRRPYGLSHDRHTAAPTGFHTTGTPPPLRASTRPARRCPYGLPHDRHTAAPTGFHTTGTPPPLRAITRPARRCPYGLTRPAHRCPCGLTRPAHRCPYGPTRPARRRPYGLSQTGVGAALGRDRGRRTRLVINIEKTTRKWWNLGVTTTNALAGYFVFQTSPSASIAAKGGSYPGL